MTKKIIPLLIVLICSLCFLGMVCAEDNTTDDLSSDDSEDMSNYIMPVQITGNEIEFSDGFIGFCINSAKAQITTDDNFTSQATENDDLQTHIKLAIIEAYKAGKENNLGSIISQLINGNKDDDVLQAAFNSEENSGDTAVVKINDTTEATFTFELLKSKDDDKSDCLAYKVSLKTVEKEDDKHNDTDNKTDNKTDNNTDKNNTNGETIINETNNTIINKTDTTIINENNTTIINQKNIKVVNKTNGPKNDTPQNKIMRTVGNPIFLLVVVIVIIAVVAFVMRRRN